MTRFPHFLFYFVQMTRSVGSTFYNNISSSGSWCLMILFLHGNYVTHPRNPLRPVVMLKAGLYLFPFHWKTLTSIFLLELPKIKTGQHMVWWCDHNWIRSLHYDPYYFRLQQQQSTTINSNSPGHGGKRQQGHRHPSR